MIRYSIGESVSVIKGSSADKTRFSACSAFLPGCILVPSSATEASFIVETLLKNNESFAVKSGGHNPNQNFFSVARGPPINLKSLNEITYDPASSTAKLALVIVGRPLSKLLSLTM